MRVRSTRGHAIVWLMVALTVFTGALAAGGGTANHAALLATQAELERTLETHRLARWAASQDEERQAQLPRTLGEAPPGAWASALAAQRPEGEGDPLRGATVSIARVPTADPGLAVLTLDVEGGEPAGRWSCTVRRMVVEP